MAKSILGNSAMGRTLIMVMLLAIVPLFSIYEGLVLWLPWTYFGLGQMFDFLPEQWRAPSYGTCILFCWFAGVFRAVVGMVRIKHPEED